MYIKNFPITDKIILVSFHPLLGKAFGKAGESLQELDKRFSDFKD